MLHINRPVHQWNDTHISDTQLLSTVSVSIHDTAVLYVVLHRSSQWASSDLDDLWLHSALGSYMDCTNLLPINWRVAIWNYWTPLLRTFDSLKSIVNFYGINCMRRCHLLSIAESAEMRGAILLTWLWYCLWLTVNWHWQLDQLNWAHLLGGDKAIIII